MVLRSSNQMGLSVLLYNLVGSMTSKMASFKPEVPISQLVDDIGTKFQRLLPCFRGRATRRDKWQYCPMSEYVENRRWRPLKVEMIKRILHLVYTIATKFKRLYPCFWGRATRLDYCGDSTTCTFMRNWRWRPVTGSLFDIMHISSCIHDSNEIPTTKLTFSGSGNKTGLLCRLPDAWICKELEMARLNKQLTDTIFNSQLIHTSAVSAIVWLCSPTLKTLV